MSSIPTFYHDQLRKYILVFGSLFNDLRIEREDKDGNPIEDILVPIKYGPRDKMLARVLQDPNLDKPDAITLPIMSFVYGNFQYDPTRKLVTLQQVYDSTGTGVAYTPVPYNINFKLYIYVKNALDGTRIVEQILPFFTPDYTPSVITVPELGRSQNIPIILNSANVMDDYDQGPVGQRRAIIWTLDFTMKAYFYGPISQSNNIIKFVTVNVGAATDVNDDSTYQNDVTLTVQPGLTANGQPTTNAAASINYKEINVNDNWAFIDEWSTSA